VKKSPFCAWCHGRPLLVAGVDVFCVCQRVGEHCPPPPYDPRRARALLAMIWGLGASAPR
jgi:hypothetical protein